MSTTPKPPSNSALASATRIRTGRCSLVGRPNVGKSTLLNALVGQRIAITAPQAQTTRSCLLGVAHLDQPKAHIAFVDTPGLHRPKNTLGRLLMEEAKTSLESVDVVVFVTDVPTRFTGTPQLHDRENEALQYLQQTSAKIIVAINKVDRLKDKTSLFPLIETIEKRVACESVIPISATKGTNLDALMKNIAEFLPDGIGYEEDFLTDRPERSICAELVREAVIQNTHAELPHSTTTLVEEFTDRGKLIYIAASIIVEKTSQRGIIIGQKGKKLKEIGSQARYNIEQLLQRKVYLDLFVRVVADWSSNPNQIREFVLHES